MLSTLSLNLSVASLSLLKKGGKHENLIKDFNEALKEMKKDGTYDKIMNKWLGDSENLLHQNLQQILN